MGCETEILQVVPSLEIGGLERVAVQLCVGLANRFRVGVACLKGEGAFADDLRARSVPVYSWGERRKRSDAYRAPLRLRKLLSGGATHIVHTHNTGPLFNGTVATLGRGRLALIHTDHARNFPVARRAMIAERLCAARAFRFVTVSEHSKRNLVSYERIPPGSIHVIPNGVDLAPFRALAGPFNRPERPAVVGAVARFTEQKALHVLVEAAALLHRNGVCFRLALVGDGPCRAALEGQAQALGLADRVVFPGFRSDIPASLGDIDVFVLSSHWEGMPLSVIEAMGAGRPVVATAVGGVPELVVDGETGCLVPPDDPHALADAIARVLADPEGARRLGATGRKRAEQQFSLEAMCAAYGALYDEALATVRRRAHR